MEFVWLFLLMFSTIMLLSLLSCHVWFFINSAMSIHMYIWSFNFRLSLHYFLIKLENSLINKNKFYILETSVLSIDAGDKYACEFCGKKLSTKHRLKTHVERHTGKKEVYKCHLCDKYFTWKDSFNAHMKRKHFESLLA